MQMVKKLLISFVVLWFCVLAFMPKEEIYYAIEQQLATYDIKLNEQSLKSGIFTLEAKDVDVYLKGIKIAHIDTIECFLLLWADYIKISNVELDDSLANLAPKHIESLDISYSILAPKQLKIDSKGDFGVVNGYADTNGTLHLDFVEVKDIKTFKNELSKNNNGWYYETSF